MVMCLKLRHSKHKPKRKRNPCEKMQNMAYRLHCDLLRDYKSNTRPVENPMDPISIQAYVALYQVINLVKKNTEISHTNPKNFRCNS